MTTGQAVAGTSQDSDSDSATPIAREITKYMQRPRNGQVRPVVSDVCSPGPLIHALVCFGVGASA